MESPAATERVTLATAHRADRRLWILLVAVAAIHIPSLFASFFIDDYVYLEMAHDLDWPGVVEVFTSPTLDTSASGVWWAPLGTLPFYRPVGQMSIAVDYGLSGLRPFGFHLTNLVLHLIGTALTWRLARRLCESPGTALAVAVVFALHPIHSEAVMWVSGRFDLLVCVCMLASVLAYLNWRENVSRGWSWGIVSVLWFAIGLGCKETALILPAVLVGFELLLGLKWSNRSRWLTAAVAFGAVSALYMAGRIVMFGTLAGKLPPPYGLDRSTPLIALKEIAWNLSQYLLDFVCFIQVDPVFFEAFWRAHPLLASLALMVAGFVIVVVTILAWRKRAFWIGLIWLALFTAPSLLAMPGERNVYLASVGVALIAAAAFAGMVERRDGAGQNAPWRLRGSRGVVQGIVCLWVLICLFEQGVMCGLAATGAKVFRDLESFVPEPVQDARIYIVNQCPFNSVGFAQAVRLRYDRPDLGGCALTLSPTLRATSRDNVFRIDSDAIRIVREDGVFFESFFERFFLFSEPASVLSESCREWDLELLDPPTSYQDLTLLEFRLPYPVDDPRIQIFYWENRQLRRFRDLLRITRLTGLKHCEVQTAEP